MTRFRAIGAEWGPYGEGKADDSLGFHVEAWACGVARLVTEAREPKSDDYWGFHDYVGTLYLRDRLERRAARPQHEDAFAVVFVADEVFRTFTEADHEDLLQRLDPELPREPWWWRRIPRTGPARGEIDDWVGKLATEG